MVKIAYGERLPDDSGWEQYVEFDLTNDIVRVQVREKLISMTIDDAEVLKEMLDKGFKAIDSLKTQ